MGGTELEHVRRAFDSNYIAPLGPQLAEFEDHFRRITGFAHCVGVTSGTAAMHLALRHLGVGPGQVVVASTLTFIGSVTPVLFLGASLHFVDADPATWNMDPSLLEEALETLTRQGRTIGVVIPTDLYGQCADYDRLEAVCRNYGVPLVIDAAEALGAEYEGRPAGRAGKAAIYSFNGNKIITTSGGGLLASDDEELIRNARWLSQQARDDAPHYEHSQLGYNYRMSNLLAAVGLGQLEVLPQRIARRREIAAWYQENLGEISGLTFMPEADYGTCNRWLTVIQLDPAAIRATPEDVRLALETENIESRPVWKPMHLQPLFTGVPVSGGAVSEGLFARGLCLPSGTAMDAADLERVANVVRRVVR